MSGYQFYQKYMHAELKKKTDQKFAFNVISKYISTEWGKLSSEEKEEWKSKAKQFSDEQQNQSEVQLEADVKEEEDFDVSVRKRERTPSVTEESDSDDAPILKRKKSS